MNTETDILLKNLKRNVGTKTRVMIALCCLDHLSYKDIARLRVSELEKIAKNYRELFEIKELNYIESISLEKLTNERAFSNPSGRNYTANDIENMIIKGCKRINIEYPGKRNLFERLTT